MSLSDLLGMAPPVVPEPIAEPPKVKKLSPFDFVNAIHTNDRTLITDEETEKQYNAYIINRSLSFGADTVVQANEMNSRNHVPRRTQYLFLCSTIRPRKRFNKWLKPDANDALELVKRYYGYSAAKAQAALHLLTQEQLDTIRARLYTGGKDAK